MYMYRYIIFSEPFRWHLQLSSDSISVYPSAVSFWLRRWRSQTLAPRECHASFTLSRRDFRGQSIWRPIRDTTPVSSVGGSELRSFEPSIRMITSFDGNTGERSHIRDRLLQLQLALLEPPPSGSGKIQIMYKLYQVSETMFVRSYTVPPTPDIVPSAFRPCFKRRKVVL